MPNPLPRLWPAIAAALAAAVTSMACGGVAHRGLLAATECQEATSNRDALAVRFAPFLYLNPDEPFEILAVVAVFHPTRPLVAYHIFFEEDALLAGRGKSSDHEIAWVEYDPTTLEVSDVRTLWHRAVLRTEACISDARLSGQRPRLDVQWGQHGILPLGWEEAPSLRTRILLRIHYLFMKHLGGVPGLESKGFDVSFRGSWADYLRFTKPVDVAAYLGDAVVAEHCEKALAAQLHRTFKVKKEWPDP